MKGYGGSEGRRGSLGSLNSPCGGKSACKVRSVDRGKREVGKRRRKSFCLLKHTLQVRVSEQRRVVTCNFCCRGECMRLLSCLKGCTNAQIFHETKIWNDCTRTVIR